MHAHWFGRLALLATVAVAHAWAADGTEPGLEDLIKTEITSVGRKSQSLINVPAPVFVLSADDIRRSGALALPEVLRLVPGIEVAQIDSGRYAVSARGFNGRFANKLQVLIDGRSFYLPTFSGAMWEHDPIALEDIERIEVIRGPGAAMWGVNAVSGVINIISKHSRDQAGGLVATAVGNHGQGQLYGRYGGGNGADTTWKLSYHGRRADPSRLFATGGDSHDRLQNDALDFRFDRTLDRGDLTVWGQASDSEVGDLARLNIAPLPPMQLVARTLDQREERRLLGARYRFLSGTGIESSLQVSLNHSRVSVSEWFREKRETADLDYQGRLGLAGHDLLWGLSHRSTADETVTDTPVLTIAPGNFTQRTTGLFVQDDWTLLPERLQLGIGARWDHTNLGGETTAANATLMWTPSRADTIWLRYARAPRMPSRAEHDVDVLSSIVPMAPLPIVVRSRGNHGLKPEHMTGFDLGYRTLVGGRLTLDATLYRYRYRDRVSGSPGALDPVSIFPFGIIQLVDLCNCTSGRVSGLELSADWPVAPGWRLLAAYTVTRIRMDAADNPLADADARETERATPRRHGSLRSQWNLDERQQLDATLRGAAGFERADAPYPNPIRIPGYVTLDLRYAYKVSRTLELAVAGRNLTGARRTEFISDYLPSVPVEVRRSVLLSARWSL